MSFIKDLKSYNKKFAIDHLMGVEGGQKYTDIKSDRGGKTRFGCTEAVINQYKHLWSKYNYNGDVSTLPGEMAFEIYELGYWNFMNLDSIVKIHPLICDRLLDIGVNRGCGNAGRYLQRLLNVFNGRGKHWVDIKVDGDIGPKTVECLLALAKRRGHEGIVNIIVGLMSFQATSYIGIAENDETQEDFSNGWGTRVSNGFLAYAPLLEKPFK